MSNGSLDPSDACVDDWSSRQRLTGPAAARSLCWRGDALVDWVIGGNVWTLDGAFRDACRSWGYGRLDAAVADPTGRWAVVHERTGTAGILLCDGEIVREIHRSPYHADAFVYPVCLFPGRAGRTLLAHCPDHYARIEIDDAATGERLTRSDSRDLPDFFHSRLAASPTQKRLLSAGWVWHPIDAVVWFDIEAALVDPTLLDGLEGAPGARNVCLAEESSAAWLDDDTLVIGSSDEAEDPEEAEAADAEEPGARLSPRGMAVYDIRAGRYTQSVRLGYPPGIMMPVGRRHVVTFYQWPRLVSLDAGRVVHEWSDISTGEVVSSIVHDRPQPVIALDASRARFAVANGKAVEVVTIDPTRIPA